MRGIALVLTTVAVMAAQAARAESPTFAQALTFEGVEFSREETGELKARALLTSVTLCEFAKYSASDPAQQRPGPRLLVMRFARKLSAEQVQQVFRGVVDGRQGFSSAELESFLGFLPAVTTGAVVHFRSDVAGSLAVFAGTTVVGSVAAPELAAAVWAGLAGDSDGPGGSAE